MVAGNIPENIEPQPEAASASTGPGKSTPQYPKRSWKGFLRDIVIYFVVYIVISGITIGPLFWFWFGSMYADGPKWFARLYLPLAYLCEICPPLRWVINEWVNWWIL